MREIRYLPEFEGDSKNLTNFLVMVENHLSNSAGNRQQTWRIIQQAKIKGKAMDLLLMNNVTTWTEAKELLKQHYRPIVNSTDLTREISSMKVPPLMLLLLPVMLMTSLVQATLVITPIESKNGFTIINMGEGEIINQTQTVIHIINTNNLIDTLQEIKKYEIVNQDQELKRECSTIFTKILSIMPPRHV